MDETERKALGRAASGPRPIGAYAARALDPSARARGFATTALLSEWPAIVGAELAEFTMPDRLVWARPRRAPQEAPPKEEWAPARGRRGSLSKEELAPGRSGPRAPSGGPARHRGAAPFRTDPRAGQHLF